MASQWITLDDGGAAVLDGPSWRGTSGYFEPYENSALGGAAQPVFVRSGQTAPLLALPDNYVIRAIDARYTTAFSTAVIGPAGDGWEYEILDAEQIAMGINPIGFVGYSSVAYREAPPAPVIMSRFVGGSLETKFAPGEVVNGWVLRAPEMVPGSQIRPVLEWQAVVNTGDSTIPLGLLGPKPQRGDRATLNNLDWAGVSGVFDVSPPRRNNTSLARMIAPRLRYLVSPRPTITINPDPSVNPAGIATVRIFIRYSAGDPVRGLHLRLESHDGRAQVFTGSYYDFAAATYTNVEGRAEFKIRGVNTGTATFRLTQIVDNSIDDCFDPELPIDFTMEIVQAVDLETDCVFVPAQPEVPGTSATVVYETILGWDAGANSIDELDDDVRVAFDMGQVSGVVLGLNTVVDPEDVGYERIQHGFFFETLAGVPQFRVMESGQNKTARTPYAPADTFEIQRAGGTVSYLHNAVRVFRSIVPSTGPVRVSTSLFATGDSIP